MSRPTPLLFLDLDGTVRHGYDELGRFVNGPEDVVVFPEAIAQMRAWKAKGGRIVGVTNQGGIALGLVSLAAVRAGILETNRQCEDMFDHLAMCSHHPEAKDPIEARCWCRKPRPGLAFYAISVLRSRFFPELYSAASALFVGDRPEDQGCAEALNVDFMWSKDWRARSSRGGVADDLEARLRAMESVAEGSPCIHEIVHGQDGKIQLCPKCGYPPSNG